MRNPLYSAYERRLVRQLNRDAVPRHVGMIVDGNRRFAKARGRNADDGHRAGAANIASFLEWCEDAGVEVVTLWLLSTDNLTRPPEELDHLLRIIEGLVADLASAGRWQLHSAGALDMLPAQTAAALCRAEEETAGGDLLNGIFRALHTIKGAASFLQLTTLTTFAHAAEDALNRLLRLPAVAVGAQRVLLLRGLLARLPPGRLPACPACLRRSPPPLRRLTPFRTCLGSCSLPCATA